MEVSCFPEFQGSRYSHRLHRPLKQRSIETFIDDDELERGEIISDQLLQAIDKSLISLVILSEKYASSHWCLDELQRILESKKCLGREVIPVFYKLDPSHVRYQGGAFAHAFQKHVERYDPKKVQGWRDALKEIADISGYHSLNRHESKLIEEIVTQVWTKLQPRQPYDKNEFVGIESKIDKLSSILRIGLDDVCLLGIWGMGGLGKTSLARAIYQRIQSQFDASYFYANVREISKKKGLVHLQRKFLSCSLQLRNKEFDHIDDEYEGKNMIKRFLCKQKVLMVLDDVSEMSQLEFLAIKKDWLSPGSRVIVTTRDKQLLTAHGEFETYVAEFLNDEESLQLLCQWAFKSDQPPVDYLELSKSVVEQAAGLPLTLKVMGCHLCGRNMLEWKDVLGKMKQVLPNDIINRLQISYDSLDILEKKIFLDVACFFKEKFKDEIIEILEICGFHPIIGIKTLVEKCLLVETDRGCLGMHDILQEMGKSIVLEESIDVGKRSRLWSKEDINHVLTHNKGTDSIEVIYLESLGQCEARWGPKAFSMMHALRILIISCDVYLPFGLKCLPSSLRILRWKKYPSKSFPVDIHPIELVELKMQCSNTVQLWNDTLVSIWYNNFKLTLY
ncbi:disease resistance protein Roq1-like [Prosopis cineraria]|uniref:disease resistance protein Roq1-like n=1 Tax=Prosopis cineraria TaxID=364024 RepID=UPI00240FB81D|nr:disease resistance protein Roq1-like [Prosopis cineraria]